MANLIVEQKTVLELLGNKKAFYLIPDYQRPYAWGEQECSTMWNDIYEFAIPDNNAYAFDNDEEYFLGPIVTFENNKKKEVIDGQQRLTTLLLLLRAFYCGFGDMQDENSLETKKKIEECIWKTNEFNKPDMNILKIDSEVASDEHKEEFLSILKTGIVKESMKSNYANNYRFFQKKIEKFLHNAPTYFPFLPNRIMKNCILLPIEAESQDTALRIFSTLNDRGKQLSDADIFKAQLYKHYMATGKKDEFINRWKELEALCSEIYHPITGTPMDEAFTRYMYYERAKQGIKSSTTEALRKFYEGDNSYAILKKTETFDNIVDLTKFWESVSKQDEERFSDRVLRRLFVLNYAPNGMWTYIVSVYYMANRDENGLLDDEKFFTFLNRIIGFIWAYAVVSPGVNALRTPVFAEMVKIINGDEVDFAEYRIEAEITRNQFDNYKFSNNRTITKSMLVWWAFNNDNQELIDINALYEIEHIFARKRAENDGMKDLKNLESLGNKAILEKRINIRASDYHFSDKKKYYTGFTNKGKEKEASKVYELIELANRPDYDFNENEIKARYEAIIGTFMKFLESNGLTTPI